ncbi:MAG TPA: cytochrome c oxidase subunit 3 [Kofleriaceae bacterium]|nr:cytochrome c oxidase subunit 3 [Kofleriaceae bacterium]
MTTAHEQHGAHDEHGHDHGSPWIQHHFDDGQHQFDSGKLGIWFFLVQEILFFSGLFVAYILYRNHHPEIYAYAHHYLDVKWGAINTAVLIISSLTAAWSVRAAQLNQQKVLVGTLATTIVCACGFLGIKYIEYTHKIHEGILFGKRFDPCIAPGGEPLPNRKNECHGVKSSIVWDFKAAKAEKGCLEGDFDQDPAMPRIQAQCDVAEVTYAGEGKARAEKGRRSLAPCDTTPLPGKEGWEARRPRAKECWELIQNPWVCPKGPAAMVYYGDDKERGDNIEIDVANCKPAPKPAAPPDAFGEVGGAPGVGQPSLVHYHPVSKHDQMEEMENGPPPPHTNMFFSIYFAMTGLHGLHVLFGIFVYIWLLIRATKGHFGPTYFGPVDYAALYWHLVDLIWIFLFPLLYLIH